MGHSEDVDPQRAAVTRFAVNVDDLGSFQSLLKRELDHNLTPAAAKVRSEHTLEPGFGANTVSGQIAYTRQCYIEALQTSTNNMAAYITKAQAIIDGIHDVLTNYQTGDLDAQQLIMAINARLAGVAPVVTP